MTSADEFIFCVKERIARTLFQTNVDTLQKSFDDAENKKCLKQF